jgi:peptidyl-tRNA hydrolase, PTH1 family
MAGSQDSGDSSIWLLAGLGNPGSEYEANRHNIGFMVADLLAERWGPGPRAFRAKFQSHLLETKYRDARIILQKPMEFMNVSGGPIQRAMAFYKIHPSRLLVIHDEIDLPFGKLRVKEGGGHGGHNGLRSITQAIGPDYLRIRVGVGRPGGPAGDRERVVGHVLSNFSRGEKTDLDALLARTAEAVEALLASGVPYAMNNFNAP